MHNLRDAIGRIAKGDVITAEWLNRVLEAATRQHLPPGGMEDGAGAYPARANPSCHWGLVQTTTNPDEGEYPKAADRPDTYWCKFLSPDLAATPVQQGYHAPALVEEGLPLGLLYFLGNRYVPEGTILRAWHAAPGREPILPSGRTDLWIAFDQQQVATFVVFELVDPLKKTDATVKAKFLEYWDGQRPWDPDDNPEAEFELVNTGLIFPWEWNISEYPAGTKGIAALDPESGLADPISYRILFAAESTAPDSSDPSDPGSPVQKCVLLCGTVDSEGCYNAVEAVATFPPGTTFVTGATRRLMMCAGSNGGSSGGSGGGSNGGSNGGSEPGEEDWYIWHDGEPGQGYFMITQEVGVAGDVRWQKGDQGNPQPEVEGSYAPGMGASGTVTVSDAGGMDVNVSGAISPDANGYYQFTGLLHYDLGVWKRVEALP